MTGSIRLACLVVVLAVFVVPSRAADAPRPNIIVIMAANRTELNDLARQEPDRVEQMAALWDAWAARVGVLPWPLDVAKD